MRQAPVTILLILATFQFSNSQTFVLPGDVSGTWKLTGSPYLVQGDITVPGDSALVIEPGVSVVFQGHYALNVQGRLLALGTASDSIRFTVSDTTGFADPDTAQGGWYGIRLIDTPPTNDSTILAYCSLEYAKAVGPAYPSNTGGAVSIANFGKVRISNCRVAHSVAGGASLPGGGGIGLTGAGLVLEGSVVAGNRSTGQGGGILVNGSRLWSTKNVYAGNTTPGPGGAVLVEGGSKLSFQGDSIVGNSSSNNGGALFAYGQTQMTIEGVSFFANAANWGGGLALYGCTLTVSGCAFSNNAATTDGGAIGASLCSLGIEGSMVNSNRSGSDGGGIYSYRTGLNIGSSSVASNRAGTDSLTGLGGGIYAELSSLQIDSCLFQNDTARMGAGIRAYNSDLRVDSAAFNNNFAFSQEGGIYWVADTAGFTHAYVLSIRRAGFHNNVAPNGYAAALIAQSPTIQSIANVLFDRCQFSGNQASLVPALGISGAFDGLVITNSIIQDNTASSRTSGLSFSGGVQGTVSNSLIAGNQIMGGTSVGAGLSAGGNCQIDVVNCTFAFNVAGSGSALSVRSGTKVRVINSIFWRNTGQYISIGSASSAGGIVNMNYSNLQHGMDSISVYDSTSEFVWGPGNIDGDPGFLDTLTGDFHLSQGSHCISAGIDSMDVDSVWLRAPSTDIEQLPRPRPIGTMPDMGAFEEQSVGPDGVRRNEPGIPARFKLEQNYPNPFNPGTNIRYQIADSRNVRLTVYDVLGREVVVLVSERKAPGTYEVRFDGSSLASGIYFYRIRAGSYVETRKLVLLR